MERGPSDNQIRSDLAARKILWLKSGVINNYGMDQTVHLASGQVDTLIPTWEVKTLPAYRGEIVKLVLAFYTLFKFCTTTPSQPWKSLFFLTTDQISANWDAFQFGRRRQESRMRPP